MARILFVDDEADTLETLKRAIEIFGHQALLATSGREAIRLASEQCPDLIIVDMMLPDMDGLAVVGRLRDIASTACIPAVILSAGPELDAAERARAAGAQDYLLKPIHLQTLLDVIAAYATPSPPKS